MGDEASPPEVPVPMVARTACAMPPEFRTKRPKESDSPCCNACKWYRDFMSPPDDHTCKPPQERPQPKRKTKLDGTPAEGAEITAEAVQILEEKFPGNEEMKTFVIDPIDQKYAFEIPGITEAYMEKLTVENMDSADRVLGRYLLLKRDQREMEKILLKECGFDQPNAGTVVQALEAWCNLHLK